MRCKIVIGQCHDLVFSDRRIVDVTLVREPDILRFCCHSPADALVFSSQSQVMQLVQVFDIEI